MPREICQSEAVAAHGIRSLCGTCLDAERCTERYGSEMLAFTVAPDENKEWLVTECDTYRPREDMPAFKASLYPVLIKAGVKNACDSCPAEEMKQCAHYAARTGLTTTSKRRGKGLEITVTCCSPAERLIQIGAPSRS